MSLALVRPCLGLSSSSHVPFFHISYYSSVIILVYASSSTFTLLFSCARYPVLNTHLAHGTPVPYSPYKMIFVFLGDKG